MWIFSRASRLSGELHGLYSLQAGPLWLTSPFQRCAYSDLPVASARLQSGTYSCLLYLQRRIFRYPIIHASLSCSIPQPEYIGVQQAIMPSNMLIGSTADHGMFPAAITSAFLFDHLHCSVQWLPLISNLHIRRNHLIKQCSSIVTNLFLANTLINVTAHFHLSLPGCCCVRYNALFNYSYC